jgi:hypothetical protein
MGLFDEVVIYCAWCESEIIIQTKARDNPSLQRFYLHMIPPSIIEDIQNERFQCSKCDKITQIRVQYSAWSTKA